MLDFLLNGLLSVIKTILDVILAPINLIVSGLFPDISSFISQFTTTINTTLSSGFTYFLTILPPITLSIIKIFLTFLISYYTVVWVLFTFNWVIKILNKIKFW